MGVAILLSASVPALAQSAPPRPRADAAGYVGWLAAEEGPRGLYGGDRWEHSLFGAASAGWYWTDHLKTEVDSGAGTQADAYHVRAVQIDGRQAHQAIESSFARRTIGVSQQYQYFRNAWFHPHIAGGVNLTWERRTERFTPLVVYDGTFPQGRLIEPARTEGPRTTFAARPFVAAGFKAYFTPRAFFRGDLRLAFRHGAEESLLRAGIGFDF